MTQNIAGFLGLALLTLVPAQALERPDKEFPIFQFPPTMIPRIDGQTERLGNRTRILCNWH